MEAKAPYYTKEEATGKWVCGFDTICEGWQCVRYSEGDKENYPVLYDTREEVEKDEFFDPEDDFAILATEFIEGRRAMYGANGLHITGTPIVIGYKIKGNDVVEVDGQYIVIEKGCVSFPTIVMDEEGVPKVFDTYKEAINETGECQDGQVVELT